MKYYLYCFFLLVFSFVFSQNQKTVSDIEYQKLHDKARILLNSNIDSAFIYANKIEASNNYLHKSFAFGIKSYLYQLKGDSLKSKRHYKTSLTYLSKLKPSTEKTKLNSYLLNFNGLSEWKRGNLDAALEQYLKGKKLSVEVNDIVQIIKFNSNIALIYCDIENYKLAIKICKENEILINKHKDLYTTENYENNKSNIYLSLGNYFSDFYWQNNSKKQVLDSALFYYKKAIIYSEKLIENKINAQIGIIAIYQLQKKYTLVEKSYLNLLFYCKTNNLYEPFNITCYNIGIMYFELKKHDKAIIYLKKNDSINNIKNNVLTKYTEVSYYLSKIYEIKNDPENAIKYSEKYLEDFEKSELNLNNQKTEINSKLEKTKQAKEMLSIQEKYKNEVLFKKWANILSILLIIGLALLLLYNIIEKNRVKTKVNELINEFLNKSDEEEQKENLNPKNNNLEFISKQKQNNSISIDEAKELEIITKLRALEEKKFYLKAEFNQQEVARKLKTNTTYLSYIVNKRFGKSFSEYANELKINYAINEMITNPTYRKYSTQAIAESVGFKNAISFTKSFNKRTGITPAQFIKKIN